MVISYPQVEIFLLILARIAGLFIDAPVFSAKSIPAFVKISLAIWLSAIMWFVVPVRYLPDSFPAFIFAIVIEIFIGYIIGFVSSIILQSAQAAGDIMDMQMGLSVANVLSPTTGASSSISGTFLFLIALVVFLLVDGHHLVLSALHQSFVALPIISVIDFSKPDLLLQMLALLKWFWITTIQLCAPILLLIFLSDFAFGIVSRVAPQVNVFMLGFQVKPSLGLFGLMLLSPLLIQHMMVLIGQTSNEIVKTLTLLSGR
ncbi:MAG: flagellar biosynthetic protein FliR [bacterium]